GAALPFSLASRSARGQSTLRMTLHAAWRAIVLIALGIALRSIGKPRTNFTFEDTLTQIGLGYFFLFLLGWAQSATRWFTLGAIVVGYWALFVWWVPEGAHLGLGGASSLGDAPYQLEGFADHWSKNSNFAWAFDAWFLNLFPRDVPFTHNTGGYVTLSFIPTLGTLILGLIADGSLQKPPPH